MMRLWMILMFSPILFASNGTVDENAGTIEQWGITWTLNDGAGKNKLSSTSEDATHYLYGRYCTGDYWVKGPVVISAISPACATGAYDVSGGTRTINGSMLDPVPNTYQGYDSCGPSRPSSQALYQSSLNVGDDCPLTITPGSGSYKSLISTKSKTAGTEQYSWGLRIDDAAVLTVVYAAPSNTDEFRPAYCGTTKFRPSSYREANINYDLLADLTAVTGSPTPANVSYYFQRPWIDHQALWPGSEIHPWTPTYRDATSSQMPPSSGNMYYYGRELQWMTSHAALTLNLNYTNAQKRDMAVYYIQLGIDLYGIVANWSDTQSNGTWRSMGAYAGGRKLPILTAGLLLNDASMSGVGAKSGDYIDDGSYGSGNPPSDYIHFGEDDSTFYVEQDDIDRCATWGSGAAGPDYRDWYREAYTSGDLGMAEWGIDHSINPQQSTKYWLTAYRDHTLTGFPATSLAARIMGLKTAWNHNAFFDYAERSMNMLSSSYTIPINIGGSASNKGGGLVGIPITAHHMCSDQYTTRTVVITGTTNYNGSYSLTYANGNTESSPNEIIIAATYVAETFTSSARCSPYSYQGYGSNGVDAYHSNSNLSPSPYTFVRNMWSTYNATYPGDAGDPSLASIGAKSGIEGTAITFTVSATGGTAPYTYSATYQGGALPTGATLTDDDFAWTPSGTQAGTYNITFTVTDNASATDSEIVTFTISDYSAPIPPVLAGIGKQMGTVGSAFSKTCSATDATVPADTLTWTFTGLPTWATGNTSTGAITGTPTHPGIWTVTVSVSDGADSDSEIFYLEVRTGGAVYNLSR